MRRDEAPLLPVSGRPQQVSFAPIAAICEPVLELRSQAEPILVGESSLDLDDVIIPIPLPLSANSPVSSAIGEIESRIHVAALVIKCELGGR